MASEAPDPSSSELLKDFDIADVDNWDDQNDTSKDGELTKTTSTYVTPPHVHSLNSPIQGHLSGLLPVQVGQQPNIIQNMDHLKRFQQPSMNRGMVPAQQQVIGHDYAKMNNNPQIMSGNPMLNVTEKQVQEAQEAAQQKVTQSGQALETLRALALAQEEQARKLKQDQDQASQIQQQFKLAASTSQHEGISSTSPQNPSTPVALTQSTQLAMQGPKQVSLPITTIKLPITDPKGQSGRQNSVLQLRGQLVKTPDQKLMLVTEFAGKKVGYLISPQSGQLQATNAALASQLIAKANQGNGQPMSVPKQMPLVSVGSPSGPAENATQISINQTVMERSPPEDSRTVLDSIEESSNDSSQKPFTKQESVTISSDDEDSSCLAEVSSSLKNTHLESTSMPEKKKRKGKTKKKKDKNEPVKPISPYLMFFKDTQPSVRKDNPGATLGEVSKMVAKLWEQAGKEQKQVYLDRSSKAKVEYQIKLAEYRASLASAAESPIGQSLNLDVSYTKSPTDDNSIEADESGAFTDTDHNGKVIGNRTVQAENDNPQTIILSSTDSSPEKSTNSSLSDPGMTTATIKNDEAGFAMDASDSIQSQTSHFDNNPSTKVEETVVRKRGRPRLSKNKKPSLNLPRSKRGKRAEIDESPVQEKPLKLIINIKDSKITESPTRAFAELEDNSLDERLQNNEDEDMDEKEAEEQKPSTPQKALSGFKIPKRQRPSTEENDSVKNENQNRSSKVSTSVFRKCARPTCDQAAKITKERGALYCSNNCLVLHCKNVFETWVDERKNDSNKD